MSNRMLVATRKGLFSVERSADTWAIARTCFLGDNVTLAFVDTRDGTWYAALDHGHFGVKLHRSPDQGESWEECGVPTYPPQPEELPGNAMGPGAPWKLQRIWALEAGGPDQPGVLWAGTIPGGLFRSDDRGATWQLNESLWFHERRTDWFGGGEDWPGMHSILVDPRDHDRILVAVSCGGAWLTEDGGATWECRADGMWAAYMPPDRAREPFIQDPHHVVQCLGSPDHYWCQHHNGVFRSTDGSGSWTEIPEVSPSVFGFAVAVHPRDPQTVWFVPAVKDEKRIPVDGKVVVARTRDGGQTFDMLRAGLPQDHAYDITFRHALDVDETGDCLVFGSTTGSVYVTHDQGDTWQTISEHLPPVYSVRFEK